MKPTTESGFDILQGIVSDPDSGPMARGEVQPEPPARPVLHPVQPTHLIRFHVVTPPQPKSSGLAKFIVCALTSFAVMTCLFQIALN